MRVTLVPAGDDEVPNIIVDLLLQEGGFPSPRAVAFGVQGGLAEESEVVEPFLLRADGEMDFGTGYEDDRYANLNLRGSNRPVLLDSLFTLTHGAVPHDAEIVYRVDRLTPLA